MKCISFLVRFFYIIIFGNISVDRVSWDTYLPFILLILRIIIVVSLCECATLSTFRAREKKKHASVWPLAQTNKKILVVLGMSDTLLLLYCIFYCVGSINKLESRF